MWIVDAIFKEGFQVTNFLKIFILKIAACVGDAVENQQDHIDSSQSHRSLLPKERQLHFKTGECTSQQNISEVCLQDWQNDHVFNA